MLYKFKSKASGDVIMTDVLGDQVMKLLGKTPDAPGILTVAQMPEALRTLETAISGGTPSEADRPQQDDEAGQAEALGLRQRLWPLIDMIKRCHSEKADIVWGV